MKRQLRAIVYICLLLIIIKCLDMGIVHADVEPPGGGMLPFIEELFGEENAASYMQKYSGRYWLDLESGGDRFSFKTIINIPLILMNMIAIVEFYLQTMLTYLLIVIVYFAYEINLVDLFSGVIESITGTLRVTIFDELTIIVIATIGIFYVAKIIRDQKTQVWEAILQTVIILAFAYAYFAYPADILTGIDKFSQGLSTKILEGIYGGVADVEIKGSNGEISHVRMDSADKASIKACNSIWDMFVHKPWQILEFGSVAMAREHEDNILSKPIGSEERQAYIDELAKEKQKFTYIWGLYRLAEINLYVLPILVMMGLIGLLVAVMLVYQALMIFVALLGVFIFLLALVPWWGFRVLQNWASKIIGYGSMKIILSFFIAVVFTFNEVLFNMSDKYGWLTVVIFQIAIVGGIIWKRNSLLDMLSMAITMVRSTQYGPDMINRQMRRDFNVEGVLNKTLSKRMREEGSNTDEVRRSYASAGKPSEEFHRLSSISSNDSTTVNKDGSLKNLLTLAEEILENQYELLKREADELAEKTGKEAEYDSFVKRVNQREAMNLPRFEEREKVAVAQELKKIFASGGSLEDIREKLIRTNDKESNSDKPASVISSMQSIKGSEQDVDPGSERKMTINDLSQIYVNEFNSEYGKKYDAKFMEGLIKGFGDKQVRVVLDRMKEQKAKGNEIRNPAGYLTDSLKNNKRDRVEVTEQLSKIIPESMNTEGNENIDNEN